MDVNINRLAIERLTALWALNECGLGGFMHAISSPFTGIVVGGISILLISLIALHAINLWPTLLKALSIVLLVKLSVSPHSPVTAYFAVSFQAIMGILLYSVFSVKMVSVVLLGALTFVESAIQKLFTLTLLYGQSLWDAVNVYTAWVNNKFVFLNGFLSSKTLIFLFVSFYLFSGIIVGFLIVKTIVLIKAIDTSKIVYETKNIDIKKGKKSSAFLPNKTLFFWIITLTIIILPILLLNTEYNGLQKGVYLLSRSFLILILWYIILGPLLLKGLNKVLSNHKTTYNTDIQNTLDLFPHLRGIISYSWQDTKSIKGINRMQYFLAKSIAYSIHFKQVKN